MAGHGMTLALMALTGSLSLIAGVYARHIRKARIRLRHERRALAHQIHSLHPNDTRRGPLTLRLRELTCQELRRR